VCDKKWVSVCIYSWERWGRVAWNRERQRETEKERKSEKECVYEKDVKSELDSISTPKSPSFKFANGPEHEPRLNFGFKSVRNFYLNVLCLINENSEEVFSFSNKRFYKCLHK
jgi:hypothetical protein